MSYEVLPTDNFIREAKKFAKKYRSLHLDIEKLKDELQEDPTSGIHLGNDVYKLRMAISSKGQGKRGGARIITYVYVDNEQVYLMSIYDKSDKKNVTQAEIEFFLSQIDFD